MFNDKKGISRETDQLRLQFEEINQKYLQSES
jgi:hypothetical protein